MKFEARGAMDTDAAAATAPRDVAAWNGSIPASRFFDALSLLLPAGETFVIDTMDEWRAQAGAALDEPMRAEVDRFIREERAHQRAHDLYNGRLIAERPAAAVPARRVAGAADELAGLDLHTRLALAAAFEQLTAVLSHEVLAHPRLLAGGASAQARLWRWHAREELAHCHVATQAAARAGVRGARRIAALCLASGYLGLDVLRCWRALCRCDIDAGVSRGRMAADALRFAWRCAPSIVRMAGGWWGCVLRASPPAHAG